jgi:hypothetical protein
MTRTCTYSAKLLSFNCSPYVQQEIIDAYKKSNKKSLYLLFIIIIKAGSGFKKNCLLYQLNEENKKSSPCGLLLF